MMGFLKHATAQPFIAATGAAALVHSTWALAVGFSGEPPAWDVSSLAAGGISIARWAYWLVPALLIAFALDVGQIATSGEIRAGARTPAKYITFIVFAVATYYLQWFYIVHHMPALPLGPGVYDDGLAGRLVLMGRNAAIWFIPVLLPLSTTMYTLSGGRRTDVTDHATQMTVEAARRPVEALPVAASATLLLEAGGKPREYKAECECGWQRTYDNPDSAKRGLAAHSQHCIVQRPEKVAAYSDHEG